MCPVCALGLPSIRTGLPRLVVAVGSAWDTGGIAVGVCRGCLLDLPGLRTGSPRYRGVLQLNAVLFAVPALSYFLQSSQEPNFDGSPGLQLSSAALDSHCSWVCRVRGGGAPIPAAGRRYPAPFRVRG